MPKSNLVLLGFMGTGKTALAAAVSRLTGMPWVDTDALVERAAGLSPAELIRTRGEVVFRALEASAVAEAARLRGHVIATGGGVPLAEANLVALGVDGVLVLLTATPRTLAARLAGDGSRPLLREASPEAIAAKLAERAFAYASIPDQLATDGRSLEELARELQRIFLRRRADACEREA